MIGFLVGQGQKRVRLTEMEMICLDKELPADTRNIVDRLSLDELRVARWSYPVN
jgi:hypothetical protein